MKCPDLTAKSSMIGGWCTVHGYDHVEDPYRDEPIDYIDSSSSWWFEDDQIKQRRRLRAGDLSRRARSSAGPSA